MEPKTRELHPDERRMLKMLSSRAEKSGRSRIRLYHYAIAMIVGAGCAWLAVHTERDFVTFLFGTAAVFALCFIVFVPFEVAKSHRRHRDLLHRLAGFIDRGTVATLPVEATKIALAPECEDESDLYIVELADGRVLHIRDLEYNLKRIFPCLRFEVYDDEFFGLTGRRIRPLSEKIEPIAIDREKMRQSGAPAHLSVENISFDQLIEKINA